MQEIRNLDAKFKAIFKKAKTDSNEFIKCCCADVPILEHISRQAEIGIKNALTLDEFHLLVVRKLLEKNIELMDLQVENKKRADIYHAKEMIKQLLIFKESIQNEILDLNIHIGNMLFNKGNAINQQFINTMTKIIDSRGSQCASEAFIKKVRSMNIQE